MGEKIRNRIRNKSFIAVTALITTIVIILVALIGNIYATEDKHYAVDVVKGSASNEGKDKNLLIRDEILKKPDGTYEDKELMYQVELKNIIEAANITGADSIHPGFCYLSENSKFAKIIEE